MKIKKQIVIITSLCSILLIGSISSIILVATYNQSNHKNKKQHPLDRDDSYNEFNLHAYIDQSVWNSCLDFIAINNHYQYRINETKYLEIFHNEISNALKKTQKFRSKYKEYRIELNYQIDQEDLTIKNDLVWYLEDQLDEKFYDQFEIKFIK